MKKNFKWIIPIIILFAIVFYLFSSAGMGKVATDLTQAYADETLYQNAIEIANSDEEVIQRIGTIESLNKMTILNGEVNYTNNNKTVNSTIKITGEKGNAKLDITANQKEEKWDYEKINIRIKHSDKTTELIEILQKN
ncbi:cytochrome c oxidase assembly factor Coa1 family protein [Mesonia maritima]|uniref:Cytochrome oxidase complex assembly protein 1 n=1 Tax=Mesonia maritima TaxID=1793873 RepID=A0ABU1K3G8_9FLAO|nr:cytochrome c oxidase assembly factor Coa1 family protein [Mesonia maritima]MDR6300138.1 hypothetical protein [Mesonia maritima]